MEVLLNLGAVRTRDFSWDITLNGSYNKTKLLRLLSADGFVPNADPTKKVPEQIVVGNGVFVGDLRQVVGEELGQLYSFGYQRNAQGLIIHGSDGLPLRTAAPISFGSALPKYIGGITNSFTYKGVNLSFLIDFKLGGKMMSGTNLNLFRHGLQMETLVGRGDPDNKMVGVGVNEKGEANTVRAFVQDYYSVGRSKSIGEQVVYDAGFWKLRQISLGYDFTKLLPRSLFIKGIRLNAVANNVLIIKKWVPNIDPEQFGFSSDNLVRAGIDGSAHNAQYWLQPQRSFLTNQFDVCRLTGPPVRFAVSRQQYADETSNLKRPTSNPFLLIMKKTLFYTCLIALLSLASSCDKGFDDLNVNPTAATSLNPVFTFNNAMLNTSFPGSMLVFEEPIVQQMFSPNSGVLAGGNFNIDNRGPVGPNAALWQGYYQNVVRYLVDVVAQTSTDPKRTTSITWPGSGKPTCLWC